MKFVGLAIIFISLPLYVFWLQSGALNRRIAYFAVGLLPFVIDPLHLSVTIVDWAMWPGYAKGIPISLLDTLAVAILITHRHARPGPSLLAPFLAYMAVVAASSAFAGVWAASAFYLVQLLRVLVVFLAVAAFAKDLGAIRPLTWGMAAGIAIQAAVAISQKAHGIAQATGTMIHQNLLGMMTHFVLFPLAALMLTGKGNRFAAAGVACALIVIALGGSRATIGLAVPGVVVLLLLSAARRMTPAKMRMIGFSLAAVLVAVPLAFGALANRATHNDTGSSDRLRDAMERAAHLMIADHPFGVGANQYVVVANVDGYSDRAGVLWTVGSRGTNVHDFYLLTAAELSWLGTAIVVLLFASAVASALRFWWNNRKDPRGEIALGVGVAMAVVAVHNLYEWIFVTSNVQYMFAINLGLLAGMIAARKREAASERKLKRAVSAVGRTEPDDAPVGAAEPVNAL